MQYSESSTYPAFDLNAAASGIYTLAPDASSSIESFLQMLQERDFQVFHLEGAKITTNDRYFKTLAELFQFPDYFGGNWDAVADCLTDLDWQEGDRIVVVYSDCEALANIGIDWNVAIEVWVSTIEVWQAQGVMVALVTS
jgi:Barstar (barnase inhibitor)